MKDYVQVGIVIYLNEDGSKKSSKPILMKATPELLEREQKMIADMEKITAEIVYEELETTLLETFI